MKRKGYENEKETIGGRKGRQRLEDGDRKIKEKEKGGE